MFVNSSPRSTFILGTIEKLAEKLLSDAKNIREQAIVALLEKDPDAVLNAICSLLLTDISSYTRAACFDISERLEGTISLESIQQDGWLDDVRAEAENFELVSRIIGERYLAYSILLGLQIDSIKNDQNKTDGTIVQFTADNEMIQMLPLEQFKSQVTSVLLSIGPQNSEEFSLPLTEQKALELIGELSLLVAPLFDISVQRLFAVKPDNILRSVISVKTPSGYSYLNLRDFHHLIVELIQRDLEKLGPAQLSLELNADAALLAYQQQNWEEVISQLETWPGLLSTMLRSPAKKQLTADQLLHIAKGTQMLADVYQMQDNLTWAKEIYRLGIRYVENTTYGGPLYFALGLLHNNEGEFGQAIGYLRRALSLGDNPAQVYAALGKALLERKKVFGAYLAFKEANTLGADIQLVEKELNQMKQTIEKHQILWLQ